MITYHDIINDMIIADPKYQIYRILKVHYIDSIWLRLLYKNCSKIQTEYDMNL